MSREHLDVDVEVAALASRLGALGQLDAPLGARTTYRVGGTAALLVDVRSRDELATVAHALEATSLPVLVVGRGSNLLVADGGFRGIAVALSGEFELLDEPVEAPDGSISVRAGGAVPYPVLARRCSDQGLTGLEWAVGVPGSVGGGVKMNAGGHGNDTSASLVGAEVIDLRGGTASTRNAASLALTYRHSNLTATELVTAATFAVVRGDADASRAEVASIVRWRREHQPGGANCGSVFTNPPSDHAARLVEAAGAKGRRHGTAMVSDKHANFIQADRDGSADDVAALIVEVRDLVAAEFGVTLRTEVRLVGFEESA